MTAAVALILRRQDSKFIPEWDRDKFWSVFHDGVGVGVIVLDKGRSDEPARWNWIIHLHAGRTQNGMNHAIATSGSRETREEAMLAFRHAFERCLAFIGDEGWAEHIEHKARIS